MGAVLVRSALEPDSQDLGPVPRTEGRAGLQSPLVLGPVPTQPNAPLHKHQESQKQDGQTRSRCLDKAVLARDVRYQPSQE